LGGIAVLIRSEGGSERRTVTRESCSKLLFSLSAATGDEFESAGLPPLVGEEGSDFEEADSDFEVADDRWVPTDPRVDSMTATVLRNASCGVVDKGGCGCEATSKHRDGRMKYSLVQSSSGQAWCLRCCSRPVRCL